MDKLDVKPRAMPRASIKTEDQARNFVRELMTEMDVYRQQCNVAVPDNNHFLAQCQKRDMWAFLAKHGEVIGALKAFKASGLISDKCFEEMNAEAIDSLRPSEIQVVMP